MQYEKIIKAVLEDEEFMIKVKRIEKITILLCEFNDI